MEIEIFKDFDMSFCAFNECFRGRMPVFFEEFFFQRARVYAYSYRNIFLFCGYDYFLYLPFCAYVSGIQP